MPATTTEDLARTERRVIRILIAVGIVVVGILVFAIAESLAGPRDTSPFDEALPNPMGGLARTAPGEATGETTLAGLEVAGTEIAMGDVGLGITYVPGWEVTNPTDAPIAFTVGQPQVIEGCCPGPVYANGELTEAGQELTVAPRAVVLLQFPLQMHPGMDGPHHLAIPLAAADDQTAVHVTGNFTADADA